MSEHSSVAPEIEYRLIPGFEGYRVGDDGSVWSRWNRGTHKLWDKWHKVTPHERVHKRWDSDTMQVKYWFVGMTVGGKYYVKMVHRLVLLSFVGPCPPGMQARHLDGDPSNNRRSNLEWGTPKQNCADRNAHGRGPVGERSGRAIITEDGVREARKRHQAGETIGALAAAFGMSYPGMTAVVRRRNWKHVE